jgi:plasmid stabilization system protein ParE
MKNRVIVTPDAENDRRTACYYIPKHAPNAARTWIKGARQTIKSLGQYPERGHMAPKATRFMSPFGKYFTAAAIVALSAFCLLCSTSSCSSCTFVMVRCFP